MEMNKYLIAALYVMAGCVVTVPLKAQGNTEPLRGERYRLVLTTTVKVVSCCIENEDTDALLFDLAPEFSGSCDPAFIETAVSDRYKPVDKKISSYFTSHKIRAPGQN